MTIKYNLKELEFNNHFLNQIIFHSITNTEFLNKIRKVVPIDIFKTKEKKYLIEMIYGFYDDYKSCPGENFYDIFKEYENSLTPDLYDRCMNLIGILKDITGSNPEYILRSINKAIYHFQLEEAVVEFASAIKQKKYDEGIGDILKAIKNRPIVQPYYDYFSDTTYIEPRLSGKIYKMKSGIIPLDNIIGGFKSDWLITVLGATKGGKTWTLIEFAVNAILQGLNVLFISLEMGKDQIDERFDMAFGFMSSKKGITEVLKKVGKDWTTVKENVDNVFNINNVIKNRQRIKKLGGGSLKVMAFNTGGRINYKDIDRVLDELEETEGFYTDVLVVDYLGIMKKTETGQTKKERIGANCSGLKEISAERSIISLSAMQGNRKAMTARIFHSYMVADDIDVIFESDLVMAICQTALEEKMNKARLYIANFRHGKQKGQIGLIRDLAIGQVALDTYELSEADLLEEKILEAGVEF